MKFITDEAEEQAEELYGEEMKSAPVPYGPVPIDDIPDVTGDQEVRDHLHALHDISKAILHVGDPILKDLTGEFDIAVTEDTKKDMKTAHAILMVCLEREKKACAERLGIEDTEDVFIIGKIREELDYEVDAEDIDFASLDDVESAFEE